MIGTDLLQNHWDLREYRVFYQLDGNYSARRHFISADAREALRTFFYSLLKTSFRPRLPRDQQESLIFKLSHFHDAIIEGSTFSKSKFSEFNLDDTEPQSALEQITKDIATRLRIYKLQEFNRWANRWYTLKIPLEEIYSDDDQILTSASRI